MKLLFLLCLVSSCFILQLKGQVNYELEIEGEWWEIAKNPDLGELSSERQQPVDFGLWQAKDKTWQLWSCIRSTKETGKTRLFYGWEGKSLTDTQWSAEGVKMRADPNLGETSGGLQAPYTFMENDVWYMFYGDWNAICMATSDDGKTFERYIPKNLERVPALFTEGAGTNTRDAMVIKDGDIYYCYYAAGVGLREDGANLRTGAIYCRTSKDLIRWSPSVIVSKGGRTGNGWGAHECPFVIKVEDSFYLFRTQKYGKENMTTVYCSKDPLNFGIGTDEGYFVTQLPVAAPELIYYEGQWYIVALNPELDGIRMAKLKFIPKN
jgi:hypothetical protein